MKLGDVLKKEREMQGMSSSAMASKVGVSAEQYAQIEAGSDASFEAAAALVANFAKALKYPGVDGLYYPCGIPFQEVEDYEYRVLR